MEHSKELDDVPLLVPLAHGRPAGQNAETDAGSLARRKEKVMQPLDKLGQFIATKLRDPAIDYADGFLAGRWKGPATRALQAALARLPAGHRELVRRVVVTSVDAGIHDFLFALAEAHDQDQGIAVVVDGENAAAISDGLQGEPYSADGWFARFSKHGPHPEPA
jgi:hypothetical protein